MSQTRKLGDLSWLKQTGVTSSSSVLDQILSETAPQWTQDYGNEQYKAFGERYLNDPVGFVRDCMFFPEDEGPTFYQEEILGQIIPQRRVCVRGPHGLGKTALSSWTVLWFCLTREALSIDWKIPTTASAWRQLIKFLWPEISKWTKRVIWSKVGRPPFRPNVEMMSRSLKLNYGEAFALASNRSDLIEGAHADQILYIFDESKIIPEATWNSAEGAMTGDWAYWLAVSTPGEPQGRFYEIQSRMPAYRDWWVRHVRLQEVIDAGRVSPEWANARREQWTEESAMYQNRVMGEFASQEEDVLIPLNWVEAAFERYETWHAASPDRTIMDAKQIGVDIARQGGDKTVIAVRYDGGIDNLIKYQRLNTMEVAGRVMTYMNANPNLAAQIDIVGLGAGVYDRVQEQVESEIVYPFHPQEKTDFHDRTGLWSFTDAYSAAWWNAREWLDPTNADAVALPPDDDLVSDLTAPKWTINSSGKIVVERKERVKERLGRSPDCGDAVVMSLWEPVEVGMEFA